MSNFIKDLIANNNEKEGVVNIRAGDLAQFAVHDGGANENVELDPERAKIDEELKKSISENGVKHPTDGSRGIVLKIDTDRGVAWVSDGNHRTVYASEIDPDMMIPVTIDRVSGLKRKYAASKPYSGEFDNSTNIADLIDSVEVVNESNDNIARPSIANSPSINATLDHMVDTRSMREPEIERTISSAVNDNSYSEGIVESLLSRNGDHHGAAEPVMDADNANLIKAISPELQKEALKEVILQNPETPIAHNDRFKAHPDDNTIDQIADRHTMDPDDNDSWRNPINDNGENGYTIVDQKNTPDALLPTPIRPDQQADLSNRTWDKISDRHTGDPESVYPPAANDRVKLHPDQMYRKKELLLTDVYEEPETPVEETPTVEEKKKKKRKPKPETETEPKTEGDIEVEDSPAEEAIEEKKAAKKSAATKRKKKAPVEELLEGDEAEEEVNSRVAEGDDAIAEEDDNNTETKAKTIPGLLSSIDENTRKTTELLDEINVKVDTIYGELAHDNYEEKEKEIESRHSSLLERAKGSFMGNSRDSSKVSGHFMEKGKANGLVPEMPSKAGLLAFFTALGVGGVMQGLGNYLGTGDPLTLDHSNESKGGGRSDPTILDDSTPAGPIQNPRPGGHKGSRKTWNGHGEGYKPATEIPRAVIGDMAFRKKVTVLAKRLNLAEDDLYKVINFESAGTFSPRARNPESSATGLIQFMTEGKTWATQHGYSKSKLMSMSRAQQMDVVSQYMLDPGNKVSRVRAPSLSDLYMSILSPKNVGDKPGSTVYSHGKSYKDNSGLDFNRDHRISVGEATTAVDARWRSRKDRIPVMAPSEIRRSTPRGPAPRAVAPQTRTDQPPRRTPREQELIDQNREIPRKGMQLMEPISFNTTPSGTGARVYNASTASALKTAQNNVTINNSPTTVNNSNINQQGSGGRRGVPSARYSEHDPFWKGMQSYFFT
jgi:hypothetical protein